MQEDLRQVAFRLSRTNSEIVETALAEYFETHKLLVKSSSYQLSLTPESVFLLEMDPNGKMKVLEQEKRNGVAPEVLQQRYAAKYNAAVNLVYEEK